MYKHSKLFYILSFFFILLFFWWVKLHAIGGLDTNEAYWFNITYGFIGLFGGVNGIIIARKWGGFRSLIGKALLMLSFGLLSEWVANLIWGYYNIVQQIEMPYPSEADIFFFGIIPLYALAMFYLAKATKANLSFTKFKNMLVAILVPLTMLLIAYTLFLRQGLDTENSVRLFFDLAYPLGEVVTFSIAILTFYLTKDYLGGIMKKAVLGAIGAYLIQFIADYGFLITALNETYYNANWVDLIYATAMTAMSLAIINFNTTLKLSKAKLNGITKTQMITEYTDANIEIYKKVFTQMIRDQEKIIGPLALTQANDVGGLFIENDYSIVRISSDPQTVLNDLVNKYEELFGKTSVEVLRESVRNVIKKDATIPKTFTLEF